MSEYGDDHEEYENGVPSGTRRPLLRILADCFKEFVAASLTILSIYGIKTLVQALLSDDRIWGVLPIKYCTDTVDLAVFARFVWQVVRSFND